jgi:mannose-6-phosphate isomerase
MPSLTSPLRFEPFLRPVVWGGRRLGTILHKPLPTDESYGESWDVSDHPSHQTRVATGPFAGATLRELMERHRAELLGPAADKHAIFPWLIKFLDARDWLSVQVHPDDAAAQRLAPGEGGKTEAWFILGVEPGSRVWAGLKPGVGREELRERLRAGTVADCLHSFAPAAGQCIFLPAGTVHAVGGNVLMTEIQQTSDATFRLFDWNRTDAEGRPRTLHIEQGLAAIDWSRGPVQPIDVEGFPGLDEASWPGALRERTQRLVDCPYFSLSYRQGSAPMRLASDGRLMAVFVLAGEGRLASGEVFAGAQVWLLPAALAGTMLTPTGKGIVLLTAALP